MGTIETFEAELLKLDPEADDFVVKVDDLVMTIDTDTHERLIPSIFKFFELNALSHCGAPGTLVHLTEDYYPNYIPMLIESLQRKPSLNTILMLNRILNSQIALEERESYLGLLRSIVNDQNVHEELREEARHYLEFQAGK